MTMGWLISNCARWPPLEISSAVRTSFLGCGVSSKKRVGFDRFMGEAAAAGLFPGKSLIENCDLKTSRRQPLSTERTGRPSADNYDFFHSRFRLVEAPTQSTKRRV